MSKIIILIFKICFDELLINLNYSFFFINKYCIILKKKQYPDLYFQNSKN